MSYLQSQLWNGRARYFLIQGGKFIEPWAPYALLDFAAVSLHSVPNVVFEDLVTDTMMTLGKQGRPFLLLMLDEAMRLFDRRYDRAYLLEVAEETMRVVPADSQFRELEYAFVRHLIQVGDSEIGFETEDLVFAANSGNPFAAGARAKIKIRENFDNAFDVTYYSATLGNRHAPLDYVVQHFSRCRKLKTPVRFEVLRTLLTELAKFDDPVALFNLAVLGDGDQAAMLLSAADYDLALWNIRDNRQFVSSDETCSSCRRLADRKSDREIDVARLMQAALSACWDRLAIGI